MSAFPKSGRSRHVKLREMRGRFRPQADMARCADVQNICCRYLYRAQLVVLIEEGHAYELRFEDGEIVVYDGDSGRIVAREKDIPGG